MLELCREMLTLVRTALLQEPGEARRPAYDLGKVGEVHPLMWVVSLAFVLFFANNWLQTMLT